MQNLTHKDLLNAGVHFGHLTRKWHPNMAPLIFMERNGIHIIDLNKTLAHLQKAMQALQATARSGRKILFVATKKQAKRVVEQEAKRLNMPYITERWLGGTLTNFVTIRKLLKKLSSFDKLMKDSAYKNMAKKEQLTIAREQAKLERLLQGISDVTRLPEALFVVDIKKENIAVKEARKLGIPVFALVDTNTDPSLVDYPIPSNDDAARAVEIIVKAVGSAIEDGLAARQQDKEEEVAEASTAKRTRERNVEKITSSEKTAEDATKLATTGARKRAFKPTGTISKVTAAEKPSSRAAKDITDAKATASTPKATSTAKKSPTTTSDSNETKTVTTPKVAATKTAAPPKEATKKVATAESKTSNEATAKDDQKV